ncbi:GNAT family N-acetyltransferase [Bacillus subtilis subsp. subtilis]|nr:GNAT family N-acetyltransferase [Bacillus subtilis subsp. subtilis]
MIRTLHDADRQAASALCMRAFLLAVAPSLSAAGVDTFTAVASAEGFAQRSTQGNLQLCFAHDGVLQGVAELKQGRHVAMLFVDPVCQRQGVGEALLLALLAQARSEVVSVSASLPSVPFYARHGFTCAGGLAESAGLVYQPMEMAVPGVATPVLGAMLSH